MVQVALTVFPGVSLDECEAFSLVLGRIPEVEFVGVGAEVGTVAGIGGIEHVDLTWDDVPQPDVVLVPGGLGVRETALDGDLARWLRRVEPKCAWLVASSTGTVVVAAAGLLDDQPASTHWLAASLLESYGSEASTERIVESGHIITCEGKVTAVDVALLLTVRLFGRDAARRVREQMRQPDGPRDRREASRQAELAARGPTRTPRRWWHGLFRRAGPAAPGRPRNPELDVSEWVELELVEMDVGDPPTPDRRRRRRS